MNPRCLTVFEQSCKSKRTLRDYKLNLDYFLKFYHKDYDSLLLLPQIELAIVATIFDQQDFECYYNIIECEGQWDDPTDFLALVVSAVISIVLLRKWSREWNEKIEKVD